MSRNDSEKRADPPAWSAGADDQRVEDGRNSTRLELRRWARRVGLIQALSGALIAWLSPSAYGIMAAAVLVAIGAYSAFGYLPLAAWIRRREHSR